MDDTNQIIYGLEFQARALAPQLAENNEIRFFVATQSLNSKNQIHFLEFNEESSSIKTRIFSHPLGEVWKLNSSPHNPDTIITCFNSQQNGQILTQSALLRMPQIFNINKNEEHISFENVEKYGRELKTTEFHPTESKTLATVIDGKIVIYDIGESVSRISAEINVKSPKFTSGKWSQHQQGNQFITLYDCNIKSYDIRDLNHCSWTIEDAHNQLVRDLDCNPNKQCHIATGGDDGYLKIWDFRSTKEPVFCRNDHSHWIWNVRFNTFHDQLILSSSSDCKVILTCASSVSSENEEENENKKKLAEGLLQSFEHHEDSVYSVEWSNVDPWIFASLSYDGRVIISKVPKRYKYQILF